MISDRVWDTFFRLFLEERADSIFAVIEDHTIDAANDMFQVFGSTQAVDTTSRKQRMRLKEMIAAGKIHAGDLVYVAKKPTLQAKIVDEKTVEYQGKEISINAWGQEVTGWPSINVYQSVRLVKTGKPLAELRDH